jgi:indole-3-acetate monooxygenase
VGGLEASAAALIESVEVLAQGDGSAGWCLAIAATSGLLLGYLPEAAAREIHARPEVILGGVFAPYGRATPDGEGFRVSGRWPFASGCEHCDWLMGGCLVPDADPRLMLAPAGEVRIHDTWTVMGLQGTGSHDIEFRELWIPRERTASVFSDEPVQRGPLYAFPLFGLLALAIAGVSLGIARGALDELTALAREKTPTGSRRRLAERAAAQADVARAEAAVRAARALLFETVDGAWLLAEERGVVPVAERGALRLASTHAATAAADAVTAAYKLGGSSSIFATSALQRRFRDAHVATQHMLVAPATWELTGRLLLGRDTDTSQL